MHILVTNDDGILAPGLVMLVDALSTIAKVTIISTDRNNSGVGCSISLEKPLRVIEIRPNWWQLNGTPADCVKLALSGFLDEEPDMVVSGINAGANLGDDIIYSGTAGGAIEGRFLRLPAIAVSCAGEGKDLHYETAAKVAVMLVKRLQSCKIESGIIFNVNVPSVPFDELQGVVVTRQGDRHFSEPLMPTTDGRGRRIYWLGAAGKIKDGSPGTDFHAVHSNYASLTPVKVDMTLHEKINDIQDWLDKCELKH